MNAKTIAGLCFGAALLGAAGWWLLRDGTAAPGGPTFGGRETVDRKPPSAERPRDAAPPIADRAIDAAPYVEKKTTYVFVVKDENGAPLSSATIFFAPSRARLLKPGAARDVGVSDDKGRLIVGESWNDDVVAAARYGDLLSAPAGRPDPTSEDPVELVVRGGRGATAIVRDERGAPVEGVVVTLARGAPCTPELDAPLGAPGPSTPFAAASAKTGYDGRAVFKAAPNGPLFADAASLGYARVDGVGKAIDVGADGTLELVVRRVYAVVAGFEGAAKDAAWFARAPRPPEAIADGRHARALRRKFPDAAIVLCAAPPPDLSETSEPVYEERVLVFLERGEESHFVRYRRADAIDRPDAIPVRDPGGVRLRGKVFVTLRTPSGRSLDGTRIVLYRRDAAATGDDFSVAAGGSVVLDYGDYAARLNERLPVFSSSIQAPPPCELKEPAQVRVAAPETRATFETAEDVAEVVVVARTLFEDTACRPHVTATDGVREWSGEIAANAPTSLALGSGRWRFELRGAGVVPAEVVLDVAPRAEPYSVVFTVAPHARGG